MIKQTNVIVKQRSMKPLLAKKIKQHSFIAFDIETKHSKVSRIRYKNGFEHDYTQQEFVCGSVYVDDVGYIFWDVQSMRDFMFKPEYKNRIYVATNLMFDIHFLIGMENFITDNGKYGRYQGRKFYDVVAFAGQHMSVISQGDIIKIPKLDKPKCFLRAPKNQDESDELATYCIRDSEISYKFSLFFQNAVNELGAELKPTIAQTAIDLFKRKYLKHVIYGDDDEKIAFTRKSYKGGRTEIFNRGMYKDIKYYDVNSMYPYIMSSINIPDTSVSKWIKNPSSLFFNNFGVSECEFVTPIYTRIPILPITQDKKLIFPLGHIKGTWTHAEINYAVENGYKLIKIHKQLIYPYGMREFKSYAYDLYKKRNVYKQQNSEMSVVCKLLLNSLYGKLGQDSNKYTNIIHMKNVTAKQYENCEVINDEWIKIKNSGRTASFVNPIMASYITSCARIHLHKLMAQNESDILYCDTDSIISKKEYSNVGNEIGQLKLEHEGDILIIRPKVYQLITNKKTYIKAKGFSGLDETSFQALISGKPYKHNKMAKKYESILRGVDIHSIIEITKNLNIEDDKRLWAHEFDIEIPQNSKPIILDDIIDKKLLRAKKWYDKIQEKELNKFLESDLFDKHAVGNDISHKEFLKNEIWFARYE
jgi:hypothetical protein